MCGRTLGADFVNMDNKPYCNICARKVWVQKNAQKQTGQASAAGGAQQNASGQKPGWNIEEEKKKLLEKQQKEKEELLKKQQEEFRFWQVQVA